MSPRGSRTAPRPARVDEIGLPERLDQPLRMRPVPRQLVVLPDGRLDLRRPCRTAGRRKMRSRQFHRRLDVVERTRRSKCRDRETPRRSRSSDGWLHRPTATTQGRDSSRDRRDFCTPRNRRPMPSRARSAPRRARRSPTALHGAAAQTRGRRLSIQARISAMTSPCRCRRAGRGSALRRASASYPWSRRRRKSRWLPAGLVALSTVPWMIKTGTVSFGKFPVKRSAAFSISAAVSAG